MKVIETNITFNEFETEIDFQSRIIEVDSWDSYIREFKEQKSVTRSSVIGRLYGESFPRFYSAFKNFKFDEFHLSCSFKNGRGNKMIKLAYLVDE